MKIAVNAQFLVEDKLEGLGWFTYETLKRFIKQHHEHTFYLIFSTKNHTNFLFAPNVVPVVLGPRYNHPFVWMYKFEIALPFILKKIKADLFFSPTGICPWLYPIPTVTVIHDINFVHFPKHLPLIYRLYYNFFFPRWARKAVRLATVSEFSKQDIVKEYDINPNKIDVVYNGANENLSPVEDDRKISIRKKFTEGNPYFVFVGATPPRKNLINLFKAFDIFKATDYRNYKLVFVGAKKWWNDAIRQTYESMEYKNDVIFTGRVSTADLNELVAAAEAMTYVSLFEGFGIPLLEAMWCETAIITSDCTSMPEVARDAAVYVDPDSPQSIAGGMKKIANDSTLREHLIEKGRNRRNDFSWNNSADRMWHCLETAISSIRK